MAYKFQLGDAVMSGSLAQQGEFEVQSDINESLLYQIGRTGKVSGSQTLHNVGAASFGSTIASSGSITSKAGVVAGGAISAATSIDGTGDLTMGTITMTGFTVDADGDTVAKTLATPDGGTVGNATNADLLTLAAAAVTVKSNSDFNVAKTAGFQLGGVAVTSTAAELNKLDGAGADVTAAKLTTLSALSDTEIGYVDGSGTAVVASKAVIADANKDVRTLRSLTGSVDAVFATFRASDSFISKVGTKSVSITAGAAGSSLGALTLSGTLSSSAGSTIVGDAVLGGSLSTSGSVKLAGVAAAAVAVASDSLYFLDGDGLMKSESFVDYATALAGDGLSASGGVLALDMNELTEAAVNVAADSLIFIDADGNVTRKDTWADYATAIAGAGITATNGVLSTDAAVSSTGIADANATLAEGLNFGTTTFTADRTWTLPNAPSTNDIVRVKAPASLDGNDLVIAVNGGTSHTIDGQSTIVMDSNGGAVTMQYVGSDIWLIY